MTSNQTTRIWVHTGPISALNGNLHPVRTFFDLAHSLDSSLGEGYETSGYIGRDYLVVSDENVPTVVDILTEAKMVFAVGHHNPFGHWQNISDTVLREFPHFI